MNSLFSDEGRGGLEGEGGGIDVEVVDIVEEVLSCEVRGARWAFEGSLTASANR